MALAVNRSGVILEKRDLSCHRPRSVRRCATATYQHTWPANTIDKRPAAAARSPGAPISARSAADWRARTSSAGPGRGGNHRQRPRPGHVVVLVRPRPDLDPPAIGAITSLPFASGWREWPDNAVSMSCPKGDKLIAPTAHTTDALGVTRYTYRAFPGLVTMVPSSGLTASQITQAVVKDLGVPQSGKPPEEISPQALSGSPNPGASYAGYAVTSNEFDSPINSVEGDFPISTAPVPAVNRQTSVWVDVGDFSQQTALIQAGVVTTVESPVDSCAPVADYGVQHDTSSAE
jgi:hypothetical protein